MELCQQEQNGIKICPDTATYGNAEFPPAISDDAVYLINRRF